MSTGPPKALDWPNPISSSSTTSTLGALAGALISKRPGGMTFRASSTSIVAGFGSGIGRMVRSIGVAVAAPPAGGVCARAAPLSQEPPNAVANAAFAVDRNRSRRFIRVSPSMLLMQWIMPAFPAWRYDKHVTVAVGGNSPQWPRVCAGSDQHAKTVWPAGRHRRICRYIHPPHSCVGFERSNAVFRRGTVSPSCYKKRPYQIDDFTREKSSGRPQNAPMLASKMKSVAAISIGAMPPYPPATAPDPRAKR